MRCLKEAVSDAVLCGLAEISFVTLLKFIKENNLDTPIEEVRVF